MENLQKDLSKTQVEAFYHTNFVESQVNDFIGFFGNSNDSVKGDVIDIGGGCGFFAKALQGLTSFKVRVIEKDEPSINYCRLAGIEATFGDALNPVFTGAEGIVCFNLILHHLVGKSEQETSKLQRRALSVWKNHCQAVFVNEYIYESFVFNDLSGWLIFKITNSTNLSKIARLVSKVFPTLYANTFGVGVRFRSRDDWTRIFESLGFDVVNIASGRNEGISLPRRLLLIKSCRRDSFLLRFRA